VGNQQQSLISLNRINHQHRLRVLDEREIRLKINNVSTFKIGDFSPIFLDEAPCFNNIIAVDVSTVKIGISHLGEVHAVRGATVIKRNNSLTINRTRPMIVLGEISDAQITFELEEQLKSINSTRNSIILLDGDLKEIVGVSKSLSLFESLKNTLNIIISISKGLVFPSIRLPEEINDSPFVGRIMNGKSNREYLAKLRLGAPLLKIETYPEMELEELSRALASLISIDGVEYGYPEALRIAHIYSKLLPVEVLTLRCVMQRKFGIEVLREIDNRKMLLGGFWS
jgi:hypothetical protein